MPFQLFTPRLRLREFVPGDLDFLAALLASPQVMRFYPHCCDRTEALSWLDRTLMRYQRDGQGFWLAELVEDHTPIGQVGLLWQDVEGQCEPEIGYMLDARFWGQGYATEAASAVRDLAFGELRLPYVISLIRPDNTPSQAVAGRLGMTPQRNVTFHDLPHQLYQVQRTHSA
ncbi:MAG: GNAT family N-acetyltransferase [Planctomycetaceae bacterium]|nr:GNAT family N-acetyltransferase [Planctomycetaceae bacterium]